MIVVVEPDADEKAAASVVPFLDGKLGPEISERAKRYAPKDTGALAISVEHHMDGEDLIVSATGGAGGREYAAYIELGHRVFHPSTHEVGPEWVPARPFLRPALFSGAWAGPIGARMGHMGTVLWRPSFGFGGDQRHGALSASPKQREAAWFAEHGHRLPETPPL